MGEAGLEQSLTATLSLDRKPTARHAAEARRKNASAFVNKV